MIFALLASITTTNSDIVDLCLLDLVFEFIILCLCIDIYLPFKNPLANIIFLVYVVFTIVYDFIGISRYKYTDIYIMISYILQAMYLVGLISLVVTRYLGLITVCEARTPRGFYSLRSVF